MKRQWMALIASILFSTSAQALFEVRAGYGVNTPAEDSVSFAGGNIGLSTMSGWNLDAIVSPPLIPFGFGLRYESMGFDASTGGVDLSSSMTRLSLIVNYRFIDTLIYLGPIATIGFSNDVTIEVAGSNDLEYDSDLTYSIGAEGGVSLGLIFVGAELGYNIAKYENTAISPNEIDFSGVYAKALVGFGF